jgi:hypothetical protein
MQPDVRHASKPLYYEFDLYSIPNIIVHTGKYRYWLPMQIHGLTVLSTHTGIRLGVPVFSGLAATSFPGG